MHSIQMLLDAGPFPAVMHVAIAGILGAVLWEGNGPLEISAAREELTPGSFAMLLVMVQDDEEAAAQNRSQLSMEELTAASAFMVNQPGQCAAGMGSG